MSFAVSPVQALRLRHSSRHVSASRIVVAPLSLFQYFLPPRCMAKPFPRPVRHPAEFVPVDLDLASIVLVLFFPISEQIKAGVVDMPESVDANLDRGSRGYRLQGRSQSRQTHEGANALEVEREYFRWIMCHERFEILGGPKQFHQSKAETQEDAGQQVHEDDRTHRREEDDDLTAAICLELA